MPERRVRDNETLNTNDVANNAVDLDSRSARYSGGGSAVSIGDGVLLTAAHNFNLNGESVTRVEATLREGHDDEGDTKTARSGDIHNIGDWSVAGNSEPSDFAVVTTDISNAPTASMIVFENPNDAAGKIESAGYPGQSPFNGEDMYKTEGTLSPNSLRTASAGDFLITKKDSSPTSDDGMGAVRGQSGSGVQLDYELNSNDSRLKSVNLDDKLAGTMTYGSLDTNSDVSHDATKRGAGFTPITEKLYGRIGPLAETAARSNSNEERYEAKKQDVRSSGGRWNRAAKDTARDNIANNPLDDREIADRFADNVMIADQSVTNEAAAKAISDGAPLKSDFGGSIFNETNYANQNVNMNVDMQGGFDTADYFVVGAGKGLAVEIGADNITVQKSYTTEEQIQSGVVTDGVTTQQTVTEIKSHSAKDTWRNTEAVRGTGSDDIFLIKDLSGVEKLDGRDLPLKADGTAYAENDTLSLDPSMGPVIWTFNKKPDGTIDRSSGTVRNGTDSVAFDNMETVNTRDGDIVDGVMQGAAPEITPVPTPAPIKTGKVSTEEAIEMLAVDSQILEAAYTGGERSPAHAAIQHPDAATMFGNLYHNGVETIPAEITPEMTTEDRVSELLTAGHTATLEAGLDMPEQQRVAEMAQQQVYHSYEEDNSYGVV